MKRLIAVGAAVLLAVGVGASAQAATTTVAGTNSYEKLVVNNGNTNLVFKVYAPGGKCEIKYVTVKFRDRDGTRYAMDGGCYPGAAWAASLTRGGNLIDCGGFSLRYNADKSVWTGTIPRTCLRGLAPAVKVTSSYVDDYTAMPGEVPATNYVAQG